MPCVCPQPGGFLPAGPTSAPATGFSRPGPRAPAARVHPGMKKPYSKPEQRPALISAPVHSRGQPSRPQFLGQQEAPCAAAGPGCLACQQILLPKAKASVLSAASLFTLGKPLSALLEPPSCHFALASS